MAELVSRQEYPVEVDHGGFALQDWDDRQVPVQFPDGFQHGAFLAAHPGRLDFTSAGHAHRCSRRRGVGYRASRSFRNMGGDRHGAHLLLVGEA
ncbi:hypothetical protein [Streptomyces sp. NPDC093261]|uniref:hypothetical protein n=1 Tax=Streptomyces sp. NPDC093261 TaxID=3366037 RepID=UPI0037F78E57